MSGFLIDDSEIEKSRNFTIEHFEKLNEEKSKLEEIKFNGSKKTFRAHVQEFATDVLGLIANEKVKF